MDRLWRTGPRAFAILKNTHLQTWWDVYTCTGLTLFERQTPCPGPPPAMIRTSVKRNDAKSAKEREDTATRRRQEDLGNLGEFFAS